MEWIITMIEGALFRGKETANIVAPDGVSRVTKKVIDIFNNSTPQEFMNVARCSKVTYARRVMWYGDPYVRSPLAKLGKELLKRS